MSWSITYLPEFQTLQYRLDGAFRLKVTITEVEGFTDKKLFRYLQRPLRSGDETYVLTFDGVCSPSDLEEWPADEADPDRNPSFCRLDYVDLIFRSRVLAMETYEAIQAELEALQGCMIKMDTLTALSSVTIGEGGGDSSSSV